jgi:uncharacterized protein involved in exopolysaccharide biosynthesis
MTDTNAFPGPGATPADDLDDDEGGLVALLAPIWPRWKTALAATFAGGVIGLGGSFLMNPVFTATTTFIPPQQQQAGASAALASLGALAGLSTGAQKTTADQLVGLMQSANVTDRIIDTFKLMEVYDQKYRFKTREKLNKKTQITVGHKDGLVTITVDDEDPKRAAAIANQYISELRRLTDTLAVTEAQRRRVFFEQLLKDTQGRLMQAQSALADTGMSPGTLKAEPRTAAEGYAKLRAALTDTEVKLQTLRGSLAEGSPEVQQMAARAQALRDQLTVMEAASADGNPATQDFVTKYREFKYQETVFEVIAKQYEAARVDEAREGQLIQVVDPATPPERKSRPVRSVIALAGAALGFIACGAYLVLAARRRR